MVDYNSLVAIRLAKFRFVSSMANGALCIAMLLSTNAFATPDDPEIARVKAAGRSIKWNWVPNGQTERYGHAEVLISAPLSAVRAQITDYAHYKDFVPDKFHNARIIAKTGNTTDLYMQVPIMHGMLTLWQVTRFTEPVSLGPGIEGMEGRFIRGNVKQMHIVWTSRAITPTVTFLKCDLLLLPNIPAPQDAIDEELRDAAMQAVDAIRTRATATNH